MGKKGPEVYEVFGAGAPAEHWQHGASSATSPRTAQPTEHDGRRWVAPIVLLAVVVVGAATVSLLDSSDSRSTAPTTAPVTAPATAPVTSIAATTVPGAPTTVDLPDPDRIVIATPSGYHLAYLEDVDAADADSGTISELWSATDPGDGSPRWFLVSWMAGADPADGGDERFAIRGGTAVLRTYPRGGIHAFATTDDGVVDVWADGIGRKEVVRLLESVRRDGDALEYKDRFFDPGFRLVTSNDGHQGTLWGALNGNATAVAGFLPNSAADPRGFTVTVVADTTDFERTVRWFFLVPMPDLDPTSGSVAFTSAFPTDGDVSVVALTVAGRDVLLRGDAPAEEMLMASTAARPTTNGEWEALRAAASLRGPLQPRWQTIDAGMLDGVGYQVAVGLLPVGFTDTSADGAHTVAVLRSQGASSSIDISGELPMIRIAATIEATVVYAAVDPTVYDATLRVEVAGRTLTTPLLHVQAQDPAWVVAGAVVFGELTAYTAEIVAADGTVLAGTSGG